MYKTISNAIIRQFKPYYDLSNVITDENEELPIKEWVNKYRDVVPAQDIISLLCRKEFMSYENLRLFAVWCARNTLKLVKDPDIRSIEACNVAEKFANGEATKDELEAANDNACDAYFAAATYSVDSAYSAAYYASNYNIAAHAIFAAAASVDYVADHTAANAYVADNVAATEAAQLDHLLTYFE
jgi:hypothetical protein